MSKSTKRVVKGKKAKKIKGWAVVLKEGGIENADFFVDGGCCCCDESRAMAIYEAKATARTMFGWHDRSHEVVPCEIRLITKPKKK